MKKAGISAIVAGLVVMLFGLAVSATTQGGECTTFYNHSGFIPGSYDYANLHEDEPEIDVYVETGGSDIFVDPQSYGAGSKWDRVDKCHFPATTTTQPTTTTTGQETTTTTTTEPPSTTSTTSPPSTTTTTEPPSTSTTTQAPPTTVPTTDISTSLPDELPFTGFEGPSASDGAMFIAGGAVLLLASLAWMKDEEIQ